MGEVGRGWDMGSEFDKILENDMTPAARLGVLAVPAALDDGAGDSLRPRAGNAIDDAPFVLGLGTGACLTMGEAILCGIADGLMEPAAGAGCVRDAGLRGGKLDVLGDVYVPL